MTKVEYVVGAFLTELDIVTHEIPVTPITHPRTKRFTYLTPTPNSTLNRKTEHTTKKRNKQENNLNDE